MSPSSSVDQSKIDRQLHDHIVASKTELFAEQLKKQDADKIQHYFESIKLPDVLKDSLAIPSGPSKLKDAKIVFLGITDTGDVEQAARIESFVNLVGENGDTVLVGGQPFLQPLDQKAIPAFGGLMKEKKFTILGWDNAAVYKTCSLCDNARLQLIASLKKKTGVEYEEALSTISIENEKLWKFTKMRTLSLVLAAKAIAKKLEGKQRVFVIAGAAHFYFGDTLRRFKDEKYMLVYFKPSEGFGPTRIPLPKPELADNDLMVMPASTAK